LSLEQRYRRLSPQGRKRLDMAEEVPPKVEAARVARCW
jgi:hypothetical protein